MKSLVLVITPATGFGELIQQSLDASGLYQTTPVSNGEHALYIAGREKVNLVILDSDLEGYNLKELVDQLRRHSERLKLVVIPPDMQQPHPDLDQLGVDAYLSKPFYLPDLLDTVNILLQSDPEHAQPAESDSHAISSSGGPPIAASSPGSADHPREPAPDWFQDVEQVEGELMANYPATQACGVFLLRYDQLWASVGKISESEIQNLASLLTSHWAHGSDTDLARFIHLAECGGDCMLYATHIGEEYVLALVFEAEKPFSLIRKQTARLVHNLRHSANLFFELETLEAVSSEVKV
jgi:CheY-like chemotaxis protein